jgi:hypothetical protein
MSLTGRTICRQLAALEKESTNAAMSNIAASVDALRKEDPGGFYEHVQVGKSYFIGLLVSISAARLMRCACS